MELQLRPWGNSQGIRFSKDLLRAAGFSDTEVLNAEVVGNTIVLSKSFHHISLKERAQKYDGQLHLSDEIERDEPVGNEVW